MEYTEGVMVGYRHYDKAGTDVNFCFGHGLSYTDFVYGELALQGREVTFTVTNTGSRAGKETVQLYIEGAEMHQLRRFEKLQLAPGERKTVRFTLTDRDFARYDTEKQAFVPVSGRYEIQIGHSSRNICLNTVIDI